MKKDKKHEALKLLRGITPDKPQPFDPDAAEQFLKFFCARAYQDGYIISAFTGVSDGVVNVRVYKKDELHGYFNNDTFNP